jgi:hypothetical protein
VGWASSMPTRALRARWICGTVFVKRLVAWPAWWMSCDGDITMVSQDDLMVSTGISPTQYVLGVDLKMGCFCLKLKATENREHDEFPLEGSPILRPTHYLGHWRGTWNCTGLQNWKDSIPWLNPPISSRGEKSMFPWKSGWMYYG